MIARMIIIGCLLLLHPFPRTVTSMMRRIIKAMKVTMAKPKPNLLIDPARLSSFSCKGVSESRKPTFVHRVDQSVDLTLGGVFAHVDYNIFSIARKNLV